ARPGSRPVRMTTATLAPAAPPSDAQSHSSNPSVKHFTPLVTQFLDYLKLERHFSDYTVKSYGADLAQFGQYLAGDIGRPVGSPAADKITPEELDQKKVKCEPLTVREFLAYLYGQNY